MARFTLADFAKEIGLKLRGDGKRYIVGIAHLADAQENHIAFYDSNPKYRDHLKNTRAAAVILREKDASDCPVSSLISEDPYLSYALASKYFIRHKQVSGEAQNVGNIHPSATIHENVQIDSSVIVGAYCRIDEGSVVGAGTRILDHAIIGRDCSIGRDCRLDFGVCIEEGVSIGDEVIIHSNSVIGSEGFGFAWNNKDRYWEKIHQLKGVRIGNQVEIGALCTINCGALRDTVIGDGVKIDCHVHIGHGVNIGAHTIIVAGCLIGGSSVLGKYCRISGSVTILNNVNIVDGVECIANTTVMQDVDKPGSYAGYPAYPFIDWKKNSVKGAKTHTLFSRMSQCERVHAIDQER